MKKFLVLMALATLTANRIRCTTYTAPEGAITASGVEIREGIIAGKPEWIGQTARLYTEDGEYIGEYQILDTGATKGIKNGSVIDVYCSNKEICDEWADKYGDYVIWERTNDNSEGFGRN